MPESPENAIAREIVNSAFRIHRTLGPGLLEAAYSLLLVRDLQKTGLKVSREHPIPLVHEDIRLEAAFRADLMVEDKVIVEAKSVETLHPVHKKQLLTYLRLADKRLGLLINFHVCLLKDGITRIANDLQEPWP
jgi:GxxExxY protein